MVLLEAPCLLKGYFHQGGSNLLIITTFLLLVDLTGRFGMHPEGTNRSRFYPLRLLFGTLWSVDDNSPSPRRASTQAVCRKAILTLSCSGQPQYHR